MTAHFRKVVAALGDKFWLLPGAGVVIGIIAGVAWFASIAMAWFCNG